MLSLLLQHTTDYVHIWPISSYNTQQIMSTCDKRDIQGTNVTTARNESRTFYATVRKRQISSIGHIMRRRH